MDTGTGKERIWNALRVMAVALVLSVPHRATAQPANDDFADAVEIGGIPFSHQEDTDGATNEVGEPQPSCTVTGPDGPTVFAFVTVWYRFTPSDDVLIDATTEGTGYDSNLAVYEGTSLADLREVGCDDRNTGSGGETVAFYATAGNTYYFQIGGFLTSGYLTANSHQLSFALKQGSGTAIPPSRQYVTMSDGVELAVYLTFPGGWDGRPLPAIFEYDFYKGGGAPVAWAAHLDTSEYVLVHAGMRGSGCSGGRFRYFTRQQAVDGAALVEWIAAQPWSDGNVGMFGLSGPGIMAAWVAAENPPHLRAISISGVFADFYREFVYPGGIPNPFLPLAHATVLRRNEELTTLLFTPVGDTRCAGHVAGRPPDDAATGLGEEVVNGAIESEDSDWWSLRSLRSVMGQIRVPTQILSADQDEWLTGRGGPLIWEHIATREKQLLLTNSDHSSWPNVGYPNVVARFQAWLDHYVRGVANGVEAEPRVQVLLESHRTEDGPAQNSGIVASDTFPLSQTEWSVLYADEDGVLAPEKPLKSGSDFYLNGSHRHLVVSPGLVLGGNNPVDALENGGYGVGEDSPGQELFWSDGPDAVTWRTAPAGSTRVVAGPLLATLHAKVYGVDAEFYVQIADEDPAGNRSLLQWGVLKASHRFLDPSRSWYDAGVMYRPWHPHTHPQLLAPGEPEEFAIEIWPVTFVLRAGHRLVMTVTSPPALERGYLWQTRTAPVVVEILRSPDHATSLLVPFMDPPADLGPEVPCGGLVAVKCAKPLLAR